MSARTTFNYEMEELNKEITRWLNASGPLSKNRWLDDHRHGLLPAR